MAKRKKMTSCCQSSTTFRFMNRVNLTRIVTKKIFIENTQKNYGRVEGI